MLKLKTKIAIKVPAPKWKSSHNWGDYYLAIGLKREFEKNGCEVLLQNSSEWYNGDDDDFEVVIVLRGLFKYIPKKKHFNIMWNISHPDMVTLDEYNEFDHVFIASELWANKIGEKTNIPVSSLLQCTDPDVFYPEYDSRYEHELLFVGNSRDVYRKIIKDLMPTDIDLAVYGTHWDDFIDEKYILSDHISNEELRKAYCSCKILLNDHWDDMRDKGFISNRLFDGFASGAFIISDEIVGGSDVFGDALVTYNSPEELKNLVNRYLENDKGRTEKTLKAQKIVNKYHTYSNRVEEILEVIKPNISPKINFQNSNINQEVHLERLWNNLINPIIMNIPVQNIIEIEPKKLSLTRNILDYCQNNTSTLTVLKSSTNKELNSYKIEYSDNLEVLSGESILNVHDLINYDIIFLNGDKEVNTLLTELRTIDNEFKNKEFPLIFIYELNSPNLTIENESSEDNPNNNYNYLINTVLKFINGSESDLSYDLTQAFEGLLIVYKEYESKGEVANNIFNKINLLLPLEEERQKFSVAYNESRSWIDFIENKLFETKVELEYRDVDITNIKKEYEEKLRILKLELNTQINVADSLLKNKEIMLENIQQQEDQFRKLNNKFETLSSKLIEMNYISGKGRPIFQKIISKVPSLYILSKIPKIGFKNSFINLKAYNIIKKNRLLDVGFYLKNNHDLQLSGQDPIIHFMYYGFKEGRQPHPNFNCGEYLKNHSDVEKSNLNPLVHYSLYGIKEGRNTKNPHKGPKI
jgi:hypothetical protein